MATRFVTHHRIAMAFVLLFSSQLMAEDLSSEAMRQKSFDELEFETGGCQSFLKEQQAQIEKFKDSAGKAVQAIREKNARIDELELALANKPESRCDTESPLVVRLTEEVTRLSGENAALITQLDQLKQSIAANQGASGAEVSKLSALVAKLQAESAKLKAENSALISAKSTAATTPTLPQSSTAVTSGNLSKIKISSASASSRYGRAMAINVTDGDKSTYWISGANQTQGQALNLAWDDEKVVTKINISVPQTKNNRHQIKRVLLVYPDGSTQAFDLDQKWGVHRLDVQPKNTKALSIEFEEVYPIKENPAYKYVSINEIDILGY